jgi:hypothetical protein
MIAYQTWRNTLVCGYVNARNGFGGYTGRKAFIYSDKMRSTHMNLYDSQILEACRDLATPRPTVVKPGEMAAGLIEILR